MSRPHLACLNVKGCGDQGKFESLLALLRREHVDLCVLMESHLTEKMALGYVARHPQVRIISNSPSSTAAGVTFLSCTDRVRWEADPVFYKDPDGHALGVNVAFYDGREVVERMKVLGVYLPNLNVGTKQRDFLQTLPPEATARVDLILGDFNIVEEAIDRMPVRADSPSAVALLRENLVTTGRLCDGWRLANPGVLDYTFVSTNATASSSRLDRIYIRPNLHVRCTDWKSTHCPQITDHKLVSFKFHPGALIDRGPGKPRFNSSFLKNEEYDEVMTKALTPADVDRVTEGWTYEHETDENGKESSWMEKGATADPAKNLKAWEGLLKNLRAVGLGFQTRKARSLLKRERALTRCYENALKQTRNPRSVERINALKAELEAFATLKADKAKWNAHAQILDRGEGNHKQFYRLADYTRENGSIAGLRNPNGPDPDKVLTEPAEMVEVVFDYYGGLYTRVPADAAAQRILVKNLKTDVDFETPLTKRITIEEVKGVLWSMTNCTSPGPDGITYEFYRHFQEQLIRPLTVLMNIMMFEQGEKAFIRPEGWAEGMITLLYKKGDRTDIKNYRPISLLNTDYKIFTELLMKRLLPPLGGLLGKHQTAFMPGRHIADNIKEVQTLVDRANQTGESIFVLFLDQEKAYDRVDHSFLWRILRRVGIPPIIIRAIQNCYVGATSTVSVNGHMSSPIDILGGVRQGDPLSCPLFNMVIETLALAVLNCPELPGVVDSQGDVHKVSMFADDTSIVLTELEQWKAFDRVYKLYARASNAKLNGPKSDAVAAGEHDNKISHLGTIKATYIGSIKYLGVPVGNNVDYKPFWKSVEDNLMGVIRKWKLVVGLSLFGRLIIAKSMIVSLLWYPARCIPAPKGYFERIDASVRAFIWGKGEHTLSAENLIRPVSEGGLEALHVATMVEALNLFWIHRWHSMGEDTESRPGWIQLAADIVTHDATPRADKSLMKRPCEQLWPSKLKPLIPSDDFPLQSINFWDSWAGTNAHTKKPQKEHRHNQKQPSTRKEVLDTLLWFHPSIQARWDSTTWSRVKVGKFGIVPETIQDLVWMHTKSDAYYEFVDIPAAGARDSPEANKKRRDRAIFDFRKVTSHMLENQLNPTMPKEWIDLLGPLSQAGVRDLSGPIVPKPLNLWSNERKEHCELTSRSKPMYAFLIQDVRGSDELSTYFAPLLASWNWRHTKSVSTKKVWKSCKAKGGVWDGKFQTLLWKCLLGKVPTGQHWLQPSGKMNCPECRVPQTAEHLFWDCPIAQAVWREARRVNEEITGSSKLAAPLERWEDVLFNSCWPIKQPLENRRWRTLYSEALWAIWIVRNAWSHKEIPTFSKQQCIERFRVKIRARIRVDRQIALGCGSQRVQRGHFAALWKHSLKNQADPDYLG